MRKVENIKVVFGNPKAPQMLFVAATLTVITLILALFRYSQDEYFSTVVVAQTSAAASFLLSALLFQTRFQKLAGHVLISGGFVGLFTIAFVNGAIFSEAMFWVPFIPLLATSVASYRSAIVYTLLSLALLVLMWMFFKSNPLHYVALASALIFSCAVGVYLERSRIDYESKLAGYATSHPLTGLPSRIVFDALLERTASLLTRHKIPYVLVFIDVDGLKPVNDLYGHAAGDALLREVGTRLSEVARRSETLFHISGDEFVIIAEEAQDLERLKTRFRGISGEFVYMNFRVQLSVSVGATHGTSDSETSLAAADSDMYKDKSARTNLLSSGLN